MADGAPHDRRQPHGGVGQEARPGTQARLAARRTRGALLRLDRLTGEALRRGLHAPALHAAAPGKLLVEHQRGSNPGADRGGPDAAGGTRRVRGETSRPYRRLLVRGRQCGAAVRLSGALGGKPSRRLVLGDGDAELPPHRHSLGGVGQATWHEGPESRPARRQLCGRSADPDPAVRDGAGLGGEGARGPGVAQDSRARLPARWRTSSRGALRGRLTRLS